MEKEGFYVGKATSPCAVSESFTGYEDPGICKAMQIVSSAGYFVCMEKSCFDERKARLKDHPEEHSNAPASGSPALKEAASQFNDALLDEQGKKIKRLSREISRLNKAIRKKSEDLRLTKIREKNLAELGLKYVGENEKLKKDLAGKVVGEINARALKSAESALAYKEKVIAEKDEVIGKLTKENNDCRKAVEEFRNKIADMTIGKIGIQDIRLKEKDEVIGDLCKELAATKKELEEKKLTAKTLDFNAKCMKAARESINDVFESYAAKYAKITLDELKDKAYESFNAKAHKLGLAGSKDGKGIPDQMIRADISEELSKVPDDVTDRFLLFGGIIIKEGK